MKNILNRENNFIILRLIAAFQVFFNHVIEKLQISLEGVNPLFIFFVEQFPGVPIFFLISGFLICKSYLELDNLKNYLINRVLRIYPALLMSHLIASLMLYYTGSFSPSCMLTHQFIFFNIIMIITGSWFTGLLLTGYPYHFPTSWGGYPNGPTWTILIELGFYLLVPLFLYRDKIPKNNQLFSNKSYILMLAASIVSISLMLLLTKMTLEPSAYNSTARNILNYSPFPYLWIFIVGGLFFLSWKHTAKLVEGTFLFWLTLYWIVAQYDSSYSKVYELQYDMINFSVFMRIILLSFCVFSFAFTFKKASHILNGIDISYGVYLYHYLVIKMFIYFGWVSSAYFAFYCFFITVLMALLSWVYLERPMLRYKRNTSTNYKFIAIPKEINSEPT